MHSFLIPGTKRNTYIKNIDVKIKYTNIIIVFLKREKFNGNC